MRVLIVGGGITGLSAAYELVKASEASGTPVAVRVLEASPRLGGKIRTEHFEGATVEAGPDAFLTAKPWALELVRELGLEDRLLATARPRGRVYVFSRGSLRPLPDGMLGLWNGPLSWRGRARALLDLVLSRREPDTDETVAEFVVRRLGREALERIFQPLVAGVYAGEPEKLSLRSTLGYLWDMERRDRSLLLGMRRRLSAEAPKEGRTLFMSLQGGMQELVETLAGELGPGTVSLNAKVDEVVATGRGCEVRMGSGEVLTAEAVLLTVPAPVAGALLDRADPELAAELRAIPFASSLTAFLSYPRGAVPGPLEGFGFLVPREENRYIIACTWVSSKFPGRSKDGEAHLRVFAGGQGRQKDIEMGDAEVLRRIRTDLQEIMGIREEPKLALVYRWNLASPVYPSGHEARLARIESRVSGLPGVYLAGASYRGVGIPDCILSGREAARRMLSARRLQPLAA